MGNLTRKKLEESTVRDLIELRDHIQLDPEFQRAGDIWTKDRRQLLIDSILNDFDIPKLYFRELVPAVRVDDTLIHYSVIDGRQRLEALWAFIDGKLPLGDESGFAELSNMPEGEPPYYQSLQLWVPSFIDRFLDYRLDVITIEATDDEVVEDMFLRLNESSALSAAEKRNAFGGPIPPFTRELAQHEFFLDRLPYANTRYRHFDIAAKFLLFEQKGGVADTKKAYLDRFVRTVRSRDDHLDAWMGGVLRVLEVLTKTFVSHDVLLKAVGMASVYYLVVRQAEKDGWVGELDRSKLETFEAERLANRRLASQGNEADADYDLLQFDSYAQSPNDAVALRFRRDVLLAYLGHPLEPTGEDSA